nr:MAG TPA: hypothetical protein [Caudoviricetes sp.]
MILGYKVTNIFLNNHYYFLFLILFIAIYLLSI